MCNKNPCPCTVNCNCTLSEWSAWSDCTKECGGGISTRKREWLTRAVDCKVEVLEETQDCNQNCCQIDGNWNDWEAWSDCSATCNSGLRTRIRKCNSPAPSCDGADCDGTDTIFEPCNTNPCGKLKFVI